MKYYDKVNGRLVFTEQKATPEFWDKLWQHTDLKERIESQSKNDHLVFPYTRKFLTPSKDVKILEGGCGMGHFVLSLDRKGYDAYGVDYTPKTIANLNTFYPDMKFTLGDVRKLDFKDDTFDGYWSLGVIEHFYDGYGPILSEMERVIKPGGYLFITIPYMSPFRKLKARLGRYKTFVPKELNKEEFYQFALNPNTVRKDLADLGFKVCMAKPLDAVKGIKEESNVARAVVKTFYGKKGVLAGGLSFLLARILNPFSGHIILIVSQKQGV